MVVISTVIIVSKRLSANQRSLYAYDDHVPIEHNTEISIRRVGLVLLSQLSQLSPPVHKLLILMLVLEGSSGVYYM